VCFIGGFLSVFEFSVVTSARLSFLAAAQMFLSGKAEIAVETRQVFQLENHS
jgi:hypothetical protein